MPILPLFSVNTNLPVVPTSVAYDKPFAMLKATVTATFSRIFKREPERRVVDAGNGQYQLRRRGKPGHLNLNPARPEPVPAEARVQTVARGEVMRPNVDIRPAEPPPVENAGIAEAPAKREMEALDTARKRLQEAQEKYAHRPWQKVTGPGGTFGQAAIAAAEPFVVAQGKAEKAVMAGMTALLAQDLPVRDERALRGCLVDLLQVRQPRAGATLKAMISSLNAGQDSWRPVAEKLVATIEQGVPADEERDIPVSLLLGLGVSHKASDEEITARLRALPGGETMLGALPDGEEKRGERSARMADLVRYAGGSDKMDREAAIQRLADELKRTVTGMIDDICLLHQRGQLNPELFRALSEVESIWHCNTDPRFEGKNESDMTRSGLDAVAGTAQLLRAMVTGNYDVIDFVMAGDPRRQDMALELKLKAPRGESEDAVRARHALGVAKQALADIWVGTFSVGKGSDPAAANQPIINRGGAFQVRMNKKFVEVTRGLVKKDDKQDDAAFATPESKINASTLTGTFKRSGAAGRDVNLLIANVILLERTLAAQGHASALAASNASRADIASKVKHIVQDAENEAPTLRAIINGIVKNADGLSAEGLTQAIRNSKALNDKIKGIAKVYSAIRDIEASAESASFLNQNPQRNQPGASNEKGVQSAPENVLQPHTPPAAGAAAVDPGVDTLARKLDYTGEQYGWLRSAVAELTQLFDGHLPSRKDLDRTADLANAIMEDIVAEKDVDQAKADVYLGLEAADLQEMGFSKQDSKALISGVEAQFSADMKGILDQKLSNTKQIGQVTAVVNANVKRLFDKGMAQGAMRDVAAQFPEARALAFVQTVERGTMQGAVHEEPGLQGVHGAEEKFPSVIADKVNAWGSTHRNDWLKQKDLNKSMDDAARNFASAHQNICTHMRSLKAIDDRIAVAHAELNARATLNRKQQVNADNGTVRSNARRIDDALTQIVKLEAMEANINILKEVVGNHNLDDNLIEQNRGAPNLVNRDQNQLAAIEQDRTSLQNLSSQFSTLKNEVAHIFESMRSIDSDTLGNVGRFSNGTRIDLPERDDANWLARARAALEPLAGVARHVKTLEAGPARRELALRQVAELTVDLETALNLRRDIMAPSLAAGALTNAIRATIARMAAKHPEGVNAFEPMAHRAEIEAELNNLGIAVETYGPEISSALMQSLDGDVIGQWQEDAADYYKEVHKSGGDEHFREGEKPGALRRFGRLLDRHLRGERVASWGTQRALMDSVAALKIGESLVISHGEAANADTLRVPVDVSGTWKVRAALQYGFNKALEVRHTDAGYEVYLSAGRQGAVSGSGMMEPWPFFEAGVSLGANVKRQHGVVMVFDDAASANALLEKMFQRRELKPTDWATAKASDMLDATSFGFNWAAWAQVGKVFEQDAIGVSGGEELGVKVSISGTHEGVWTERKNAFGTVKEKETRHKIQFRSDGGAWLALPNVQGGEKTIQ